MQCPEIQELILESFVTESSRETRARVDAHLATCADCTRFVFVQKALDQRMSAVLVPFTIPYTSRTELHLRIRQEPPPVRADVLPEIVHFGSFAVATLVMAAVLPMSPLTVTGVSVMLAIVSYVLLSVIRNTMEDCVLGTDA
jgi:hypothetical protein